MKLSQALGKKFADQAVAIRTRSFELGGHTFKVRVPLTSEMEAIQERFKEPDDERAAKYYEQLTATLDKDILAGAPGIELTDDDIVVEGRSMRELAKQKAVAEQRIVEMFRLLVPEEADFDMATVTYDMIEELFPFAIQIEMMEAISKTIAPDYKAQRAK